MFYEVIPGKAMGGVLTYRFDGSLLPGQMVEVPLGRGKVVGVVVRKVVQPEFATKPIVRILYSRTLPKHLLAVAKFISEYYGAPIGSVMGMILPNKVPKTGVANDPGAKNRTKPNKTEQVFGEGNRVGIGEVENQALDENNENLAENGKNQAFLAKMAEIPLNEAQKKALEGLQKAPGATKLLFGLTGSGKTNVYLREAARALSGGKSVVVLVPEIALTSQLVQVFRRYFGERVVLIHSQQKVTERRRVFEELLLADEPKVVIGPRSALFAPVRELGLIVIDEEHEGAYYQENAPRYSAVRVASFLAQKLGIWCILGSATPNVTDYYLARRRGTLVELSERAKQGAGRPKVRLIDLKNRENFSQNRYFSNELLAAVRGNLEAGRQTLIFHNRRGSSPLTICDQCGEEIICPECFLPLTLHADSFELVCHTCDYRQAVPMACPKCGAAGLVHKGFGTKLLETELGRLFPKARVRRFDADNRRGETLAASYEEVRDGEVDILVGTQTVAKGLDLPRLATVGVVQADAGLSLPDFAAEERTFQLLTQVMGRVGRGHLEQAEVFVQTFRPEHPIFKFALEEDYAGFAEYLLSRRREAGFPPYRFVAQVSVTLKTERLVVKKVRELAERLSGSSSGVISETNPGSNSETKAIKGGQSTGFGTDFLVSPPMPAFHERTSRGYTWQIVVRSRSREKLVKALSGLDKSFRVELDPPSLL